MTNQQALGIVIAILFLMACFAIWCFYMAFRK